MHQSNYGQNPRIAPFLSFLLGDFAILLKSGLTFRQAVTYNVASAVVSYIGLVLGIIIGDIHSAHSWVLALTAGMFLYVSLVDMVSHVTYEGVPGDREPGAKAAT